ncbi:MAG: hypothetical protein ACKVZH_18960 [Blastocatellia bacterium]
MQIEAEKRALLRWTLIVVTVLFAFSLVLSGLMYQRYSTAEGRIEAAENRASSADAKFEATNKELLEKKKILEANSAAMAKQDAVINTVVPKMVSRTATDAELAELAHAAYSQPGHMISLPSIPPNEVLRSYRYRGDGRPLKYTIVPGMIDGKWVVYSLLVKNQEDK